MNSTHRMKLQRHVQRKARVHGAVRGSSARPRLSVFRSNKNISAQVIDDETGRTLVSASSTEKAVRGDAKHGGNRAAAAIIGKRVAERAKEKGIAQVAFDRNGYRYHGRIKALADAARESGLQF